MSAIGWKSPPELLELIVVLWNLKRERKVECFIAPAEHEVYCSSTILSQLDKLLHHEDYKKSFQFPEAGYKRLTLLIYLHSTMKRLEWIALQQLNCWTPGCCQLNNNFNKRKAFFILPGWKAHKSFFSPSRFNRNLKWITFFHPFLLHKKGRFFFRFPHRGFLFIQRVSLTFYADFLYFALLNLTPHTHTKFSFYPIKYCRGRKCLWLKKIMKLASAKIESRADSSKSILYFNDSDSAMWFDNVSQSHHLISYKKFALSQESQNLIHK